MAATTSVRPSTAARDSSANLSVWQTCAGRIDNANQEIRRALDVSKRVRRVDSRRRRSLHAIDDCLNRLEDLHAKGSQIARRDGCRKVVAQLVEAIRENPPEEVQTARNSYDLHSALLNWQSSVLDALVPHRRERFPDLNSERDEWPRPRRRRRRSASVAALAAA